MAIGSRLLSRLKKVYGSQVTLQNEHAAISSFARKAEQEAFSSIIMNEIPRIKSQKRNICSSSIHFDPMLRIGHIRCGLHCQSCRFSRISGASHQLGTEDNFATFFKSVIDNLEGPDYLWLNKSGRSKEILKESGPFIVLVGVFIKNSIMSSHHEHISLFETVRSLQQRYPALQILGFQSGSSVCSPASQRWILKTIMEEFITFPILLSERVFTEIPSEPCYLVFSGLNSPYINHRWDIEQRAIEEDLERFGISRREKAFAAKSYSSEVMDEPHACSPLRNLLLYYPSCISADNQGNRLFISDTNHHRIIIADNDGQLLDCIGSSPGFEEGDFDSSKLNRPVGSVYHADENCLYFVDSKNCAVRRADLRERVVETLYPAQDKKISGLWNWFLEKIGMRRKLNVEVEEPVKNMISCPWHLMKSGDDDLLVFSRGFETLWVVNIANGEIKDVREGFSNIMAVHEPVIAERSSLLNQIIPDLKNPAPELMSSIVNLQNDIIYCDAAGQRVIKYQKKSGDMVEIHFTKLGVLGLPYWIPCPIERVAFSGNTYGEQITEHLQHFNVLPGRCDIRVKIRIPEGTVLAEPLTEGCVWRQARGTAAEISAPALAAASVNKVGIAQQWFDELDNLAFSSVPSQGNEDGLKVNAVDPKTVLIDCAIRISPGTSEVVVSAVIYLKLENGGYSLVRESAKRLLDVEEKSEFEACIDLLLESREEVKDVVFAKPLRLRVRLDCGDHPPSVSSKDMLPTDCSLEVGVNLT